jgi:hypothetical protein
MTLVERPHHPEERIALCLLQRGCAGVLVIFAADVVILRSLRHHGLLLVLVQLASCTRRRHLTDRLRVWRFVPPSYGRGWQTVSYIIT